MYDGKIEHNLVLTMGILLAHCLAGRASMYLYGRVYDVVQ